MRVFIRLYSEKDSDLIAIRLYEGPAFSKIIKKCLRGFLSPSSSDALYRYEFTPAVITCARNPTQPVSVSIILDSVQDRPIIEWLGGIRKYARSDIIKTIVRSRYREFPDVLFCSSNNVKALKLQPDRKKPDLTELNRKHTAEKSPVPAASPVRDESTEPIPANAAHEPEDTGQNDIDVFDMLTKLMN